MPFPQMTTRRWMIAVAVIALTFGGAVTVYRYVVLRREYLGHAALHESLKFGLHFHPDAPAYWERRWTDQRHGLKGSYPWPDSPPFVPAIEAYHDRMILKWRYAADHPWLSVEPDPL